MASGKTNTALKVIDVFILVGQSNMVGFSRISLLDKRYFKSYPNVYIYNGGDSKDDERNKLVTVHPGQGTAVAIELFGCDAFGPELGMASVLSNSNSKIAFIKYAYGGTAIFQNPELNNTETNKDNWHGPWDNVEPGLLYTNSILTIKNGVNELKKNGYNPILKGLVWMQGETDGEIQFNTDIYHAADCYEYNLTQLFNHFRKELSIISGEDQSKLKIVFGQIYEYSKAVLEVAKIVEVQEKVGKLANNYLIKTTDLLITSIVDDWHWNGNWMYELGVRFGEKLYEEVYGLDKTVNHVKCEISGIVKDSWGHKLSGVKVISDNEETYTDDEGKYTLCLKYGCDYKIEFSKDRYNKVTHIIRKEWFNDGKILDFDVTLHLLASLSGVVKDDDGNTLEGVKVIVGSQIAYTNSDGYYYITGICPEKTSDHQDTGFDVQFRLNGYTYKDEVRRTYNYGLLGKTIVRVIHPVVDFYENNNATLDMFLVPIKK